MSDQQDYLYNDDPQARIARWARSLKYFRFVRSGGGMSGGGDHLLLALRVSTQQELEHVFAVLDVPFRPRLPDPAEFGGMGSIRFEAATSNELYPLWQLSSVLGQLHAAGATLDAYFSGQLELRVFDQDSSWRVSDSAVGVARDIERSVHRLADRVIDPPQDDPLCVCPKHHPDIWESPAEREARIAPRQSRRVDAWWWLLAACLALAAALRWLTGGD